jgi:hypothetical protein
MNKLPKEKAKELFNQYHNLIQEIGGDMGHEILVSILAKHCALIAIDEIEEALTDYGRGDSLQLQNMDSEFRFWEQVKTEIEKI